MAAELNPHFAGADVVILPDNDDVGPRARRKGRREPARRGRQRARPRAARACRPRATSATGSTDGGTVEKLPTLAAKRRCGAQRTAQEAAPLLTPYSDEALTLAFTERHADDLRYCDSSGRGSGGETGAGAQDVVRGVFSLARQLCRDKAGEVLAGRRQGG